MSASLDQTIYQMAIEEGFKPIAAKLFVAQARLESSDYSSNVFKNNNNMYGMKFVGQPLADRGTPAPPSERSCNLTCDRDYYARYDNPVDSARDTIQRLYKIPRSGVTFDQLANVNSSKEFAELLKKRGYYGATASHYTNLLNSKLMRISVVEWYNKNKTTVNLAVVGATLIAVTGYVYFLKKKGIKLV